MSDTLSGRQPRCLAARSWGDGELGEARIEVLVGERARVALTGSSAWLDGPADPVEVIPWVRHCQMLAELVNLALEDAGDFDPSFIAGLRAEDQAELIADCMAATPGERPERLRAWLLLAEPR